MEKRIFRTIVIILVSIPILIFGSDALVSNIFYNPLHDDKISDEVFASVANMVIPSASLTSASTYGTRPYLNYSHCKQAIAVKEISVKQDINDNYLIKGTFEYRFGQLTAEYEIYPEKQIVFTQGHYFYPDAMDSSQLDADQYYMANLAFPEGMPLWEFEEFAVDCFQSSDTPLCIRAMIKTSIFKDDVALGVGGRLAYILPDHEYVKNNTVIQLDVDFSKTLEYLAENQRHADVFLESGIFGDVDVDFSKRLDYVKDHGKQCIGTMIFAQGSYIQKLTQDPRCVLVDAYPD